MDFDPSSQERDLEGKMVDDNPQVGLSLQPGTWPVRVAEAMLACSQLVEGTGASETFIPGQQPWEMGKLQPWGWLWKGRNISGHLCPLGGSDPH